MTQSIYIHKSINMNVFKGKCKREEVFFSRLRFTGFKSNLYLMNNE